MMSRKKRRLITPQRVVLCVLAIATAAIGYSYYLQSKALEEMRLRVASQGADTQPLVQAVESNPPPVLGQDGNDELNKLTCNDGLYADLLTRYGMFEYDKFKAKREHCTINSPFPVTSGMCPLD